MPPVESLRRWRVVVRWWRRNSLNVGACVVVVAAAAATLRFIVATPEPEPEPLVRDEWVLDSWDARARVEAMQALPEPREVQRERAGMRYTFCDVIDSAQELGTANLIVSALAMDHPAITLELVLIAERTTCPSEWLDVAMIETWIEETRGLERVADEE